MDIYDYAEGKGISTRQVLDFTLLTNPLGPSGKAKHAMRKALKEAQLPPDRQTRYLRGFIARSEHVAPENILFGHGSTQILDLLLAGLKPGRLLAPSPLPACCVRLLERHGTDLIPLALSEARQFALDAAQLMPALERADIVLIPNPHPMTGTVVSRDFLREIMDALDGSSKILVIDEGLAGFARTDSPVEAAVCSTNVLILRTFSFFHALAGMRLGYALGGGRVLDLVAAVAEPGPVSAVAAAGALASLRDRGFSRRTAEFLAGEKAYMTAKLARINGIRQIDTGCNFLLVAPELPVTDLRSRFLQRRILIEVFEAEKGRELIRVPLRRRPENARFAKTLTRIMAEERMA
jgi:histidinol-phosphate/aromatic aminotransferase/cobyric acid decarboxylase-like protein